MGKNKPPKGTHIKVRRWIPVPPFTFTHHGVYVGKGWVVHLTGGVIRKILRIKTPRVQQDSLNDFCNGADWVVVEHSDGCTPTKAVRRAKQSLGYEDYHLLKNNCEHFASWCTTNDARSLQAFGILPKRLDNGKGYRKHER